MFEKVYVNIDGASKGNPGLAAIGIIIRDHDDNIVKEYRENIGKTTNNMAEYEALKKGLILASRYSKNIVIISDSELLVRQMNREYKVKNRHIRKIVDDINYIIEENNLNVEYKHVKREENKEADMLANKAIPDKENRGY